MMTGSALALHLQEPRQFDRELEDLRRLRREVLPRRAVVVGVMDAARMPLRRSVRSST
jgi:hypothetical protein